MSLQVGVRQPAVAGSFYRADPGELGADVRHYIDGAVRDEGPEAMAVVAPHAGYVYSGPVAGSAYATLLRRREPVERIVLVGPSHRVPLRGFAVPTSVAFATPLGDVRVDADARDRALAHTLVSTSDEAHALEHSLEVHLPFLQTVAADAPILPLVAGGADVAEAADLLDPLWSETSTLLVVSSDLSHYLTYEAACGVDRSTADAIEALDVDRVGRDAACGRVPLRGLMELARLRDLRARTVDLRNSGDTAGPRDRVVGYGAFVFSA